MKRKIQTEMLTTYLPTILLLGITYATTFFKPMYFEAVSFLDAYLSVCVPLWHSGRVGQPDDHVGDDDDLHEQDRGPSPHLGHQDDRRLADLQFAHPFCRSRHTNCYWVLQAWRCRWWKYLKYHSWVEIDVQATIFVKQGSKAMPCWGHSLSSL